MPRLIAIGALTLTASSQAQTSAGVTAWRCLDHQGRVSYGHVPCADERGTALAVGDARSNSQRQSAQAIAERDAKLAQWMTADRRQAERQASDQRPVLLGLKSVPREPVTRTSVNRTHNLRCRQPDCFRAHVPARSKTSPSTSPASTKPSAPAA